MTDAVDLAVELSTPLQDALAEIVARQSGGCLARTKPYFFRQASMRALSEWLLVEPMPGFARGKTVGWRVTAAGRAWAARHNARVG